MTVTREAPKPGALLRRGAVIKAVDSEARTMRFVASDESVDRYGDIIRASGWQLENFRKNPVLLFAHDSRQPPVGQVPSIEVVETELIAECLFRPEGDSQLSDDVWRAVEGGFLRAVSVGFTPTGPVNELVDSTGNWTGYEFTSQELLELSVVPVPANPQALAVAKSLGIADATARLLFTPDPRAVAQVAVEARRRSIDLLKAQRRAG
jgi:Escherichia/Staphylococcus phage prohead protease